MMDPKDVCRAHPVRKTSGQKQAFRQAVQEYAAGLGYETGVETGNFGAQNVIIGNPAKAEYVLTAHYDTCAGMPFPNLLTPCSFWPFLGWQLVLLLILAVPALVLGGAAAWLTQTPEMAGQYIYLVLVVELALMFFGPANRNNANDNTSGVLTLLETAAALPEDQRSRVCFVLFDLEELGLLGSAAYRSKHRRETELQLIINLDCVGDGDEILLFPTKKLKKVPVLLDRLENHCLTRERKSMRLHRKGFGFYPSDQANFPFGVGVAAFRRSKWAGLYLDKIHTRRDMVLEDENITLLRDYLIDLIGRREEAACE